MRKSALPHLMRIRDSVNYIQQYIRGYEINSFSDDRKTWDAVVKQIENIGEEVNRLEKGFLQAHPQLPWKDMIATRNKLTHDYWDINPKRVWDIATIDIPLLKQQLQSMIEAVKLQEKR